MKYGNASQDRWERSKVRSQSQLKEEAARVVEKIEASRENIEFFEELFQHLVIDNIFSADLAHDCLHNFPPLSDSLLTATEM